MAMLNNQMVSRMLGEMKDQGQQKKHTEPGGRTIPCMLRPKGLNPSCLGEDRAVP